jgi:hypothetical protein
MRGFATRPERFELPTFGSVDRRSIQLSYGRLPADSSPARAIGRGAEGAGFEPAVRLHGLQFSRLAHSTTLPPLRSGLADTSLGLDDASGHVKAGRSVFVTCHASISLIVNQSVPTVWRRTRPRRPSAALHPLALDCHDLGRGGRVAEGTRLLSE